MIVAVQGTTDFNDYQIFLRAMSVALSGMKEDDKEFVIYSVGPAKVNSFVSEFSNLSERGMKSRGKSIKLFKVTPQWLEENVAELDHLAFLSNPKEPVSKVVHSSKLNNINTNVYTF